MIIAIPVDDNKTDVCVSLGRTPYFLIHDTETSITKFEINPGATAEGGAGLASAQLLLDQSIDTLITVRCGQNAADVLQEAAIKIYKSIPANAEENLKALSAGTLEILAHFHAGFHGIQ
ncbi:MAG: NifB/NifX family molybdenum-iron cluster-binding protein [Eubacteriales bacterium]